MQATNQSKRSSNVVVLALVVIIVVLIFISLSEYQQIQNPTKNSFRPQLVSLLTSQEIGLTLNGNSSAWNSVGAGSNVSTRAGTIQYSEYYYERPQSVEYVLNANLEVWSFNSSSIAVSQYTILPFMGFSVYANGNLSQITSGTLSHGWQYKILSNGGCQPNQNTTLSACAIFGVETHNQFVVQFELWDNTYGSQPVLAQANETAIIKLLEAQDQTIN
jgi:hypothetical protein